MNPIRSSAVLLAATVVVSACGVTGSSPVERPEEPTSVAAGTVPPYSPVTLPPDVGPGGGTGPSDATDPSLPPTTGAPEAPGETAPPSPPASTTPPGSSIPPPSTTLPPTTDPPPTAPPDDGSFPYVGTITFDEYDWFSTTTFLGPVDVDLTARTKIRLVDGRRPRRYASGHITFLQGCGDRVSRVVLADPTGISTPITPCSSEISNPGFSPTNFDFSSLSPDRRHVAVEATYYLDGNNAYAVAVYEAGGPLVALYDGHYAPTWLPDGRLVLTGNGFSITDSDLQNPVRIDTPQLNGLVNNPAVDPAGERMVFEYNQQIWIMNLDGTDLRELVFGDRRFRYPTWSPDGSAIAYLGLQQEDYYDRGIYFTHVATGTHHYFDLDGLLVSDSSIVPNGPLSWNA